MRKSMYIAMIAGLCLGLVSTAVYADPEYNVDWGMSSSGMSGDYPVSGPVETGAVPGLADSESILPNDTHFNPFHPELRTIDGGGGGE